MSAEENKKVVQRFWGVWEEENFVDLIDELLAPDYVNHSPGTPDQPTGPEGVKAVVSMFRSGMPDLRVTIDDMIAEGDKVATRYTVEGTHEGELFGVPPTGRRVSIESMTVERVSGGKIIEHRRITDTLDMMQQLGVVPESGQEESAQATTHWGHPPLLEKAEVAKASVFSLPLFSGVRGRGMLRSCVIPCNNGIIGAVERVSPPFVAGGRSRAACTHE